MTSSIKSYFPYFDKPSNNTSYLDTASSALKLRAGIERISEYLSYEHANVHRGAYGLSANATIMYEEARQQVADYFGLGPDYVVIFTSGATDSINMVSFALEGAVVTGEKDSILTTVLEHHSNFVPWQQLALRTGATCHYSGINHDARLDVDDLIGKIKTVKPKIIAVTAHSNAFGTIPDLSLILSAANEAGSLVLVDATQSVVHGRNGLKDGNSLEADFYAFSAHKLYGPTGLGVLLARKNAVENLGVVRTGGGMVRSVSLEETTFAEPPEKFEAGTPPIAEAISFAATLKQLEQLWAEFDLKSIEQKVFEYAYEQLADLPMVKIIGPKKPAKDFNSIISFEVSGVHPHDLASIVDSFGVQIRAGHHCCQPAMKVLNVQSTARASFGIYSETQDIDRLIEAIKAAKAMFK